MRLLTSLLLPLTLTLTLTTATPTPTDADASPLADFCATAYGPDAPWGVNIVKNTCGDTGFDKRLRVTSAVNVNCVTCWFYA